MSFDSKWMQDTLGEGKLVTDTGMTFRLVFRTDILVRTHLWEASGRHGHGLAGESGERRPVLQRASSRGHMGDKARLARAAAAVSNGDECPDDGCSKRKADVSRLGFWIPDREIDG
jgi:hypothetical protein